MNFTGELIDVTFFLANDMKVRTGYTKFTGLITVKISASLWMSFTAIFTFTVFLCADLFHMMFTTQFSKLAKSCLEMLADLLQFQFIFVVFF